MALSLVNTFNLKDGGARELDGADALTTAVVGGKTLLFVGGGDDDGLSVFQVKAGTLVNLDNVDDAGTPFELDDVSGVATAVVDGQVFLLAAGQDDDGFSSFAVLQNGQLLNADNATDADDVDFELGGANSVATATIGSKTFVFVSGVTDNGVSSFRVETNGSLTNTDNVDDSQAGGLQLEGARGVATATIGAKTFLFVAGIVDDGLSVFDVDAAGNLTNVDNVSDNAALQLDAVRGVATAVVGAKTFLFTAAVDDNGVSVFDIAANGNLTNVDNVSDNAVLNLNGAAGITTANIAGITYVFVASFGDDGVSAFAVAADGTLINVANLDDGDNAAFNLLDADSVAVAVVDETAFLTVSGRQDDGVSVFRLDATGVTVTGTAGNDVINAVSSAPGQLLPSELGDTISALAGDDSISALGGADIINGGAGADTQSGNDGNDTFRIASIEALADVFHGGAGSDKIEVIGGSAVTLAGFNAAATSIEQWDGNNHPLLGTVANNVFNFAALNVKTEFPFVDAREGNDIVTGSKFADDLRGGSGNDTLSGGGGVDTLTGGLGKDVQTGGTQRDVFDLNSIAESKVGAARDVINAFQHGLDDIDLRTIDAKTGGGNQAFKFIGQQGFNHIKGELRFADLGANCLVQGDVNGDGKADFEIQVKAGTLSAGDFLL
jgi:hypothetical protein